MTPKNPLGRLEVLLARVRQRSTLVRPQLASSVELIEAPSPPAGGLGSAQSEPMSPLHVVPPAATAPQALFARLPPPRARMESSTLELLDGALEETLSEEDLVEMSSDMLESVPPAEVTELSSAELEAELEEEPPASSKRARTPSTMDEAFSGAADEDLLLEDGREIPLKTPPPESGPQEAPLPAGIAAPDAPDVDGLLEADLLPPVRERAPFESVEPPFGFLSASVSGRPTPEQLGQTIDLDEARGPELELDAAHTRQSTPLPPMPEEELELTLPRGPTYGAYNESLQPAPPALSAPALVEAPAEPAEPIPQVFERTTLEGVNVQEIVPRVSTPARLSTFVALLDASIALGG